MNHDTAAHRLYEIAYTLRNKHWDNQTAQFGDWEPAEGEEIPADSPARWWYLQGKVEALAEMMTAIERTRLLDTSR